MFIPILITSDIHGDYDTLVKVKEKHKGHFHINAGDIVISKNKYENLIDVIVKGNCDFDFGLEDIKIFEINNLKILLVHGHRQGVKKDLKRLVEVCRDQKVDWCIYGHTHIQNIEIIDGITFINPGSLKDESHPYVVVEDNKVKRMFMKWSKELS